MGFATAAAVAATAASIGGSIASSNAQRNAAKDATREAGRASRAAQDTIRQNFLDTVDLMRPRMAAGDAAIGQMMFELGLSDSPQVPQSLLQQAGPQTPDYSAYLQNNRDVAAEAMRQRQAGFRADGVPEGYDRNGNGIVDPTEYAQFHYERFGEAEGRNLPNVMVQGQQGQGQAQPTEAGGRFDRFRETPGYQFQMEEGLRAVEGSAAARYGLLRGSTLQRLQQTGQGIADQTYGQYFNRLSNLAGIGGQATNAVANAGQNTASSIANLISGQGQVAAQGQIAQGQAQGNMYGNIASSIGDLAGGVNWGNVFGGGGGGGPTIEQKRSSSFG
jgi:hypothetical protein